MPRELRCPICRAKFPVPKSGASVAQCPGCGEELDVDLPPEDEPRRPAPRRKSATLDDDDDEPYDTEPAPRSRPSRTSRPRRRYSGSSGGGGNALLVVGGVVVLLLVVGGVVWGLWRMVRGNREFAEFSPPGGNFTVLMPGTSEKDGLVLGILPLTAWEGERGGVTYVVGYADGPARGAPIDTAVLELAKGFGVSGGGYEGTGGLGTTGSWLEFQIEGDDHSHYCSGRVCYVRARLYAQFAYGKGAKRSDPEVRRFLDSFKLADGPVPWEDKPGAASDPPLVAARPQPEANPPEPEAAVPAPAVPRPGTPRPLAKTPRPNVPRQNVPPVEPSRDEMLGGPFDPPFRDPAPAGGLLVGFDVGLERFINYPVVGTLRPIYRVGDKESVGKAYGTKTDMGTKRLLAKPGYAVGAISVRTGLAIDGFSVTFMRVAGDRLDPKDAYESEWVGNTTGGSPGRQTGNGTPVVGLLGREGRERVSAIGLLFQGR